MLRDLTIERASGLAKQRQDKQEENNRRVKVERREVLQQQDQDRLRKAGILSDIERSRNKQATSKIISLAKRFSRAKNPQSKLRASEALELALLSGDVVLPSSLKAIKKEFQKFNRDSGTTDERLNRNRDRQLLLDYGIRDALNFALDENPNIASAEPAEEVPDEATLLAPTKKTRVRLRFLGRNLKTPNLGLEEMASNSDEQLLGSQGASSPRQSGKSGKGLVLQMGETKYKLEEILFDETIPAPTPSPAPTKKPKRLLQRYAMSLAGEYRRKNTEMKQKDALKKSYGSIKLALNKLMQQQPKLSKNQSLEKVYNMLKNKM